MDKQIKITLTIDGKEAIATLNMTDEKLKEIFRQTNAPKNPAAIQGATKEFTGMNQVIGQTGFLLSDMDMFFRSNDWATNMRMGAMSVSNNFSMVGQTVANAMRQAETAGMSFTQMLKTSLTGINLWMIGLNLGLLALNLVTRFLGSNTEELDKNTDAIKKNADALKEQSSITIADTIFNLEKEVDLLKKKKEIEKAAWDEEQAARNARRNMGGTTVASVFRYSGQEELDRQGKLLMLAQTQSILLGKEYSLKNRIRELEEERGSLTGREVNYQERLLWLNQQIKQKQEELNALQGKEKSGKEFKPPKADAPRWGTELYDELHEQAEKEVELAKEKNKEITQAAEDRAWRENEINKEMHKSAKDNIEKTAALAHDQTEVEVDQLSNKSRALGQVWQRTGNIIANSLIRSLGLLKQTDNVLGNIMSQLLEMGLQMGMMIALKALGKAIGIPTEFLAEGGVINEPVVGVGLNTNKRYVLGEGGVPELVTPMNRLNLPQPGSFGGRQTVIIELAPITVQGTSTIRGRDIQQSFSKTEIIQKKYY